MNTSDKTAASLSRRVSDWWKRLSPPPEEEQATLPASEVKAQIEAITGEQPAELQAPSLRAGLRLAPIRPGILVHCASCGMLHELDAVCHACGAPLCSDTWNCRRSRQQNLLGGSAITCPSCAASQ